MLTQQNLTLSDLKYFTVGQAAIYMNIQPPAVYAAINKGLLYGHVLNGEYVLTKSKIDEYVKNKYNRKHSTYEGKPLYADDEYSPQEIAKMLKVDKNEIYFLLKYRWLKSYKKGSYYIIKQEFLDEYLNNQRKVKYG